MAFTDPSQQFQPFNPYGGQGMMGMFMQMLSSQMAGQYGMMPMGFNGGNMATNMRQFQLTESQQAAMRLGGRQDIPMIMDTIRGGMQAAGQAWTPEAEQMALQAAETGINLAAMGSPQLLDRLSGGRSATAMAGYMFSGGRHSLDPVYGDIGLSANSTGSLVRDVHSRFYGDRYDRGGNVIAGSGAREWRSRTKGVSAGEMGQLYQRLNQEGMMSQLSPMSRRQQEAFEDASPEEQDSIKATRRKRAAKKTAEKLEEWTGTLAALKDVFGPNSSFDDLMSAMEGMTGGAASQMSGRAVERSIRNLVNSGDLAGVGPGEIMNRVGNMASGLESMGINSIFAQQFVGEGLNFTTGYRAAGAGQMNAWGLYGIDRQRQEHTANLVSASQSKVANRMGAVARLGNRLGKDMFTTDEGRALYKSLRQGEIPEQYAHMSRGEFIQFMTENTELSEQEVQYALDSKTANQEAVHKYGLADATQVHQKGEMRDRFMTPALGRSARVSVRSAIGTSKEASALGTDMGGVMAGSISGMSAETLADSEARNAAIAKDVEKKLEEWAADDPSGAAAKYLAKIGPKGSKERQRALLLLAEQGYSSMESQLQRSGVLKPGESYVNFGVRNADEVRDASDLAEDTSAVRSARESDAAGESGGDPLQRGMETIQGGDADLKDVGGAVLGLRSRNEVAGDIGNRLRANSADLRAAREDGKKSQIKALEQERAELMGMAESYGMTNERGEFDPSAGRGDAGEVQFDPTISFSGATVVLNGAEVLTEADGGVERTGGGTRVAQ